MGEFKEGIINGQGTFTFSDGRKYSGEFKEGKKHGQGIYTYPNGDKYTGGYKDGFKNGLGALTYGKGKSDGDKYVGEFKEGIPNGQGTYTFSDGSKWVGEFRKGKPWNVKNYDKNGKIEAEWIRGIKLKKEEIASIEEKEVSEYKSSKIRVRALLGNTSG